MSIAESLARYIATLVDVEFGEMLFIGTAPPTSQNAISTWSVIANGGTVQARNVNGSVFKDYAFQVYFRDPSRKTVYDRLYAFEQSMNQGLPTIEDVEVTGVVVTPPIDQEIDAEGRKVARCEITINVFEE